MGYCVELLDSKFEIKAEKARAALKAIKALDPARDTGSGGSSGGSFNFKTEVWFAWVITEEYKKARNLAEAFEAWRWGLSVNYNGDWSDIAFNGEKYGDDDIFFDAIAPYVTPGSYIEMLGEDGARWRWVFDGKTCKQVHATVSWD